MRVFGETKFTKRKPTHKTPSNSMERATEMNLRARKRTIFRVKADGNCLFRALADQLWRDGGKKHKIVREQVVNYLAANQSKLGIFVAAVSYSEYIQRMSKDGEWGDHVELKAAACVYGRQILISTRDGEIHVAHVDPDNEVDKTGPSLLLDFNERQKHYNSVRDSSVPFVAGIVHSTPNVPVAPRLLAEFKQRTDENGMAAPTQSASSVATVHLERSTGSIRGSKGDETPATVVTTHQISGTGDTGGEGEHSTGTGEDASGAEGEESDADNAEDENGGVASRSTLVAAPPGKERFRGAPLDNGRRTEKAKGADEPIAHAQRPRRKCTERTLRVSVGTLQSMQDDLFDVYGTEELATAIPVS
jgi:OTU-like cysteine protease